MDAKVLKLSIIFSSFTNYLYVSSLSLTNIFGTVSENKFTFAVSKTNVFEESKAELSILMINYVNSKVNAKQNKIQI